MKYTSSYLKISTYFLHFQTYRQGTYFNYSATFMFCQAVLSYVIEAYLSCEGSKMIKTVLLSMILVCNETYLVTLVD